MGALLPALPLKADAVPVVPIERVSVVSPDGGAAWRAMYEGNAIPAEPIEDHEPVVERVASKVPRRDKSAALVAVAVRRQMIWDIQRCSGAEALVHLG